MRIEHDVEMESPFGGARRVGVTIRLEPAEARELLFAARRFQAAAVPLVGFTKQESDVMCEIGRRLWAINLSEAMPSNLTERRMP